LPLLDGQAPLFTPRLHGRHGHLLQCNVFLGHPHGSLRRIKARHRNAIDASDEEAQELVSSFLGIARQSDFAQGDTPRVTLLLDFRQGEFQQECCILQAAQVIVFGQVVLHRHTPLFELLLQLLGAHPLEPQELMG